MSSKPQWPASRLSTVFLDGLRGLAAFYVLCHHALLWLQPGYRYGYLQHPEQYGSIKHLALLGATFFRFGHEGVLFFFVLSGFVIHLRYARQYAEGRSLSRNEYWTFICRRARRLYPPLLVALAMTFALDSVGAAHGYGIYAQRTPYPIVNANVTCDHRGVTLIGNLLFLMQTYVPCWGTDSPLWSLKYEWWFYAVYPVFWPFLRRSTRIPTLLIVALYAGSFFPGVWPVALLRDVFSGMIVWWFGALLAEVYAGRLPISFKQVAPLAALVPCAVAFWALSHQEAPWPIWGLGFAGVIAGLFAWQERGASTRLLDSLKPLGDCSYTLYVIHAPFLILLSGWLMSRSPTGELPAQMTWPLAALAVLPLAYALHFLTERPLVRGAAARKNRAADGRVGAPPLTLVRSV